MFEPTKEQREAYRDVQSMNKYGTKGSWQEFALVDLAQHTAASALAAEHQVGCGRCQRYGKHECDQFRATDWLKEADEKLRSK